MKNWKHSPIDLLVAQYVDCYWYLEKNSLDISNPHPRMNPEPAAHLILTPNGQSYRYKSGGSDMSGEGTHLMLPTTNSITLYHADPFSILGIKLRVGALYSLDQDSVQLPQNKVIPAPVCFLAGNLPWDGSCLGADSQEKIIELCKEMDRWLRPLVESAHEDRHSQLVRATLPLLEHTPIAELGDQLHCSRRTLERSFQRVTGLTLKQYCSMQTLDRLLMFLYQQESSPDWAELAAQFGFSDQPHLIRYLKSTIESTPGDYLKQRDLTIDVYGDFE